MIAGRIDGETVAAWRPEISVADVVTERAGAALFAERIATAYDAPPVEQAAPQPLMAAGWS